jgi:hypothetical protein
LGCGRELIVWDIASGKEVLHDQHHDYYIHAAFDATGARLVAGVMNATYRGVGFEATVLWEVPKDADK